MVRARGASLADRSERLARARAELEIERDRLVREEEYLARQVRRAEEQLRYYDRLLADLKRSAGGRGPLHEFVARRG